MIMLDVIKQWLIGLTLCLFGFLILFLEFHVKGIIYQKGYMPLDVDILYKSVTYCSKKWNHPKCPTSTETFTELLYIHLPG